LERRKKEEIEVIGKLDINRVEVLRKPRQDTAERCRVEEALWSSHNGVQKVAMQHLRSINTKPNEHKGPNEGDQAKCNSKHEENTKVKSL
jgi:hypothetical protein